MSKPNRGEFIAVAIRQYLFTNGLKKTALTGKLVAELANRALDHLDKIDRKKKRLATEEDWIASLEKEPHLEGVNVRKELAAAQFWCKNNNRQCTRKMFVNWLNNNARSSVLSAGGAKPERKAFDLYTEPPGWKESEKARNALRMSAESWENVVRVGWFDLGVDVRASILKAL